MAFQGGVSVYARPKALYLFVQQKLRNFNKKKVAQKYIYPVLGNRLLLLLPQQSCTRLEIYIQP